MSFNPFNPFHNLKIETTYKPIADYVIKNYEEDNIRRYSISFVTEEKIKAHMQEREATFSQALLKIIDEKGLSDVEVYKKAGIDRRLFSKIRTNDEYNLSKPTAIALALALSLNIAETIDLIGKSGFALSKSCKWDLVIRYFIEKGNYNIEEINDALDAFRLRPLIRY
jgi:hypothetical protein